MRGGFDGNQAAEPLIYHPATERGVRLPTLVDGHLPLAAATREKFERAKKMAATRPHPSAPDKPLANKITLRIAATGWLQSSALTRAGDQAEQRRLVHEITVRHNAFIAGAGGLFRILGPGIGPIDRTRDALSGRDT